MTSALTDSGNGKVVVRRGSIVVDSGNAAAIVVTGNGSVQAAQIDVAGGDRPSGNGKISGAVQTRHASLTGLLSSIHCAFGPTHRSNLVRSIRRASLGSSCTSRQHLGDGGG